VTRIVVELPEGTAESALGATDEGFIRALIRADKALGLTRRHDEGRLRKLFAYYLLGAGTVILVTSLALVVMTALGASKLGEASVATLIGSVAAEFLGMLYFVVRYLFREER
jgi:hypothetical protein